MCFFLRFGKYIVVPILTWLELKSFVLFEIALGKSRSVVATWCSEFSDLLGTSLFSSVQKIRLSRNLILWQQKFPHWHNVEVVVCPSFIETISLAFDKTFSIFNWLSFTKPDACSEIVIRASLQSVKTLRIEHADSEFNSVLIKLCPLVETLTIASGIDSISLCSCKLLSSVTFGGQISTEFMMSLCQLPHLVEIHLLRNSTLNHARIAFANPNLTALTICDGKSNSEFEDLPIINCQLTSLTCNMFRTHSFAQFVTNHSASLTKLDLEKQFALPGMSLILLASHCPLLTDLTLPSVRYPTTTVFPQIVAGLPRLASLNVRQFGAISNESIDQLAKVCPNIIHLTLPTAEITISLFINLRTLVVVKDPDLLSPLIFEKCIELRHFELVNFSGSEIQAWANCTNLEVLRLSYLEVRDADVNAPIQALGCTLLNLRELRIRALLCGGTLLSLLKNCRKLEVCDLSADSTLTSDQLMSLTALFTRLRRLRFATDSNPWSRAMLFAIAKKCRRMEDFSLDLRGPLLTWNQHVLRELEEINPDLKVKISYLSPLAVKRNT